MKYNAQRKLVRRWGLMWRTMKRLRDRAGARFAIERATIWRNYINRKEASDRSK